jgi:outer membrane protein assembly factor BamB
MKTTSFSVMFIFLSISLFCLSCHLLDGGMQVDNKTELLWKAPLSTGELVQGDMPPVANDSGVLAIGSQNTFPVLYFFDRNTGEVRWKWQEFFKQNEQVLVYRIYKYQNIVVINNSPIIYAIDLTDGRLLWVNSQPDRDNAWVNGLMSTFYSTYRAFDIAVGTVASGTLTPIIVGSDTKTFSRPPVGYMDIDSKDTLLAIVGTRNEKDSTSQFYFKNYLTVYNLTKNIIKYRVLIREGYSTAETGLGGAGRECVIYDRKIYINIGKSIQCHDLTTGALVWKQTFTSNFFIANIIQADGKIIGNGDDEGIMYALDPSQGKIIWQTKTTTAASSLLFYMNGVVYMTGTKDGSLYAIDSKTGKQLWNLQCPNENGKPGSFTGTVTGDNDRIYVHSFRNLYCYKAAQ